MNNTSEAMDEVQETPTVEEQTDESEQYPPLIYAFQDVQKESDKYRSKLIHIEWKNCSVDEAKDMLQKSLESFESTFSIYR